MPPNRILKAYFTRVVSGVRILRVACIFIFVRDRRVQGLVVDRVNIISKINRADLIGIFLVRFVAWGLVPRSLSGNPPVVRKAPISSRVRCRPADRMLGQSA